MTTTRLLRALGIGIALAAMTVSTTWGLLFYRPLPTVDGHYRFLGLRERGEVVRDVFGIPRIYARGSHDLFFLQGYVTAQDRLVQMEALRATARSRSLGAATRAQVPSSLREALDAYAAGVNKLLGQHAEARTLPGELVLAGASPRRWEPIDSIAIVETFLHPVPLNMSACSVSTAATRHGRAVFGADLYLAGPAPGFYEIGLDGGDRRALGVSLPGVPGIAGGHNGWVAWTLMSTPEVADPAARLDGMLAALSARRVGDLRPGTFCAVDVFAERVAPVPIGPGNAADIEAVRTGLGRPRAAVGARILVDLADVDTSRSAVSHGASGHRASSHFNDQAALWEVGQVHRLPFTRGAVGRVDGELVLRAR